MSSKKFQRNANLKTRRALGSERAPQPLYARRALPVYPVFEDEMLTEFDGKWVKQKLHKKDHETKIIATNFI